MFCFDNDVFKDFIFIQEYFKNEEKRDPSMTEIRVLDTYWSDHCRHTTFATELKDVKFKDGFYRKPMEDTYKKYLSDRAEIYKGRKDKFVSLMDLALLAMKKLSVYPKSVLFYMRVWKKLLKYYLIEATFVVFIYMLK